MCELGEERGGDLSESGWVGVAVWTRLSRSWLYLLVETPAWIVLHVGTRPCVGIDGVWVEVEGPTFAQELGEFLFYFFLLGFPVVADYVGGGNGGLWLVYLESSGELILVYRVCTVYSTSRLILSYGIHVNGGDGDDGRFAFRFLLDLRAARGSFSRRGRAMLVMRLN